MGSPDDSVPLQDPPQEAQVPTPVAHPVPPSPQPPDSFWARIKRHKVVEWTLAYFAFGYALLHGVQMLRETFDWSFLVPRLTVFGLVLGVPIAVTLAWYHGHRARHRVSGPELSILIALLVVAGSVLWWLSRTSHERAAMSAAATNSSAPPAAPFNPPPHSVAVLPFVNMSGDREQDYFSDGLSEELLNSLSRINELQVAARTSSFYFKGERADLATIAHKLNVASVLEGSVRRSGNTIRVTAQLNSAVTGFHLWSQTYDRDLSDALAMQTEIANAVANALKVKLLGDVAAKIEAGATRNPAAFDAYLRASKAYSAIESESDLQAAIAGYTEAVRLDPDYALAYADRALAFSVFARDYAKGPAVRDTFNKAQADARKAIDLAPDLAEGHLALANTFADSVEFIAATQEYERALALEPGNARLLRNYGLFAVQMGHTDAGLAAAQRSVVLDPLNSYNHVSLGMSLLLARRYGEAIAAFTNAKALDPNDASVNGWLGSTYYFSGDLQKARAACESADEVSKGFCLAIVFDKLGQHADAESMLAKFRASTGDGAAVSYALIYTEWGDTASALNWLETAMRRHDPYLGYVKKSQVFDPLRKEPRFQAIERELKFPN
jgi:TolB-like protein